MIKERRTTWTKRDLEQLQLLALAGDPPEKIAQQLGRTQAAVQSKAQREGIHITRSNRKPRDRAPKPPPYPYAPF